MSFVTRTTDPENREKLAALHRLIAEARAITTDLIASGVDGLGWVDGCLSDADGDVTGIFEDSEPVSFRDLERVVLTKRELL